MTRAAEERFWEKVGPPDEAGCWPWLGARIAAVGGQGGYGKFERTTAHRFAYALVAGPVPSRLVVDHLCRNRACVNPDHLEPVTQRENLLRGQGITAARASQTHCVNGHLFDAENTAIRTNGTRRCRTCQRERVLRKYHEAQR